MSLLDIAEKRWVEMRVRERRAFLKELEERLGRFLPTASEAPSEVFAHTVDFNSLPGDLQGSLILALAENGFSAEKYIERIELFRVR